MPQPESSRNADWKSASYQGDLGSVCVWELENCRLARGRQGGWLELAATLNGRGGCLETLGASGRVAPLWVLLSSSLSLPAMGSGGGCGCGGLSWESHPRPLLQGCRSKASFCPTSTPPVFPSLPSRFS